MSEFLPAEVRDALSAHQHADADRVWRSLPEPHVPAPDLDAKARGWAAVHSSMQTEAATPRRKRPARAADRASRAAPRLRARRVPMWAGALVAVTFLAIAGLYAVRSDQAVFIAGAAAEIVTLDDGSVVTLEPYATLTVGDWADQRPLTLEGTAFFDVARDEARPMHIATRSATVTVLGTSFTIASGASQTSVQVASGRVAVADANGIQVAELLQGDAATIGADSPLIQRSARSFDQVDVLLSELADEVGRAFAITVTTASGLADERITFVQRDVTDAESILQTVCATKGLSYRETASGFELYRK